MKVVMIESEHEGIEIMNEGDEVDREAIQIGKAIMQDKAIAEAQSIQEKLLDEIFGKEKVNND